MNMRIVADQDIVAIDDSFHNLGELIKIPGRELNRSDLINADALLVRSISMVDEKLLKGTAVRFVGSATAGTDHVDQVFLQRQGIEFSHAEGCNANAVVEYCFTALALLDFRLDLQLADKTFAIIGAGHIGGLFATKLAKLGFRCLVCDPFLSKQRKVELKKLNCLLVNIDHALKADVISLHVPLTTSGKYSTLHLLSEANLRHLNPGAVLINTSRGAVIHNADLLRVLDERSDLVTIMDVWESEPDIDTELLGRVNLASPHIAGYSTEAKLSATTKLAQDLCRFFSINPELNSSIGCSGRTFIPKKLGGRMPKGEDRLCSALLDRVLSLSNTDDLFRREFKLNTGNSAEIFDKLRKLLVNRHEFSAYEVAMGSLEPQQIRLLSVLGFKLQAM